MLLKGAGLFLGAREKESFFRTNQERRFADKKRVPSFPLL
jgi:hypothetical protein